MIVDLDLLVEKLAALEELLVEYSIITGRLASADIEALEEAEEPLEEREQLIMQMKLLEPEITEIISRQTPEIAESVRKMMAGETVMTGFSEDEKVLQGRIIRLLSVQNTLIETEKDIRTRFKSKYDEVRDELEKLNEEKKKISFYQNIAGEAGEQKLGSTFDIQN